MNLKDFINRTLLDIVEGVAEAQSSLGQAKGSISPAQGPHNPYQNIDFDLAVEGDETGGPAISVVRSGMADIPRGHRSDVSRIQFTVPVRLPTKSG